MKQIFVTFAKLFIFCRHYTNFLIKTPIYKDLEFYVFNKDNILNTLRPTRSILFKYFALVLNTIFKVFC